MKVIVIGGGSGSGKTTLASQLSRELGEINAPVLCVDRYYRDLKHLQMEERERINFDHPDSFDWDYLEGHIRSLMAGESVSVPQYDYATHTRSDAYPIVPGQFLVLEGILVLYSPFVRQLSNLKVFVDAHEDVRLDRRRKRDVVERGRTPESVDAWWNERVEPMYREHVAPLSTFADLIVSGEVRAEEAVAQIIATYGLKAC